MTSSTEQTAGVWTTFRESPAAVKAIVAGVSINRLGGLLNIFLVLFLTAKGYSSEQATLALGVYGAGAVIGLLLGGAMADRIGPRNATVLSMSGSSILFASLLYLPSYPLLLGAVALVSLIGQMYRPASSTLLSALTPESRQVMMFALYRFALNLGTTAAPLIGFALYRLNHRQYTILFWSDATAAMAYAIVALIALPKRTAAGRSEAAQRAAIGGAGAERGSRRRASSGYLQVLADRKFSLYLVASFLNAVVYVQYLSTLPLDVRAAGVPVFWYSFAVSLNGLIVIGLEPPVAERSQRWPMRLTIPAAILLVGVGMACYGLPLGPVIIVLGTLIWTSAELIGAPAGFAYPAIVAPARLKSRYIGSSQVAFGLGTATGPLIGGVLFSLLGHAVWPVIALVSLLATSCAVAAVRPPPAPAEMPATSLVPANEGVT
jgi:predicted MFS family arabinose efflux permease